MTALRLAGRPVVPIDLLLVRTAAQLVRSDGTVWVEPSEGSQDALRRGLAFAGLGAFEDEAPAPRPDLVPALGSSLVPASEPAIETLTLRRVPLSEAMARALGSRGVRAIWPPYRAERAAACRELLRETDEQAWWERRAWLPGAAVRRLSVRRSFRPIVFDRAALAAPRPGGVLRAREGAITRWAFG